MGAAFASALWSAWKRLRRLREARSELYAMTERELRDIGLSRSGIEAAISQIEAEPRPTQPEIRDSAVAQMVRKTGRPSSFSEDVERVYTEIRLKSRTG